MNYCLLFLSQFLQPIKFEVVGQLSVGELLLPLLLLLNAKRAFRVARIPLIRTMLVLGVLFLVAMFASDIYRGTPSADYLRGWSRVGVFLVALFTYLGAIWKRPKAVLATVYGMIGSVVLTVIVDGIPADAPSAYKWRFGLPLAYAVMLVAGSLVNRNRSLALCLVGGVGFLSLLMNYRSLGGIALMTATVMAVGPHLYGRHLRLTLRKAVALAALLIMVAWGMLAAYDYLAPRGALGREARIKYEQQTEDGDSFGLLSGRAELYYSLPKIAQSPLVGWGSWPKDLEYVLSVQHERFPNKYDGHIYDSGGLIPSHSHLFGGWLEAGLLGAVFWMAMLWISGRNLVFGLRPASVSRLWPLLMFVTVMFIWDLLFSPFGGALRMTNGFRVAWMCLAALEIGFFRLWQLRPRLDVASVGKG